MTITILQNGFVTGDFLEPVAYAGEMNSKFIDIVHPLFENAIYQLIIVKNGYPYKVGITDGKCMLPPSLTDVATTLQCQFVAARIMNNDNGCDCYPDRLDDCAHMVFKSDEFKLTVKQGLNLNGLTPIPTYESVADMYNNLSKAKLAVEKAKADNMAVANTIDEKINELQSTEYKENLNAEISARKLSDEQINVKVDKLLNMFNSEINNFIETTLQGKAILSDDNTVIITGDINISDDFVIPGGIKLVIPQLYTITLNENICGKIQGNVVLQGNINVTSNVELFITGQILISNVAPASIFNVCDGCTLKINVLYGSRIDKIINNSPISIICKNNMQALTVATYIIDSNNDVSLQINGILVSDESDLIDFSTYKEVNVLNNSSLDINNDSIMHHCSLYEESSLYLNGNAMIESLSGNTNSVLITGSNVNITINNELFETESTYKYNKETQEWTII